MFGLDWAYFALVLPTIILAMWAQHKVSSTFKKYSAISNAKGLTGAETARSILLSQGISDVRVERIAGNLTDNYDPRSKVLHLSDAVYSSTSLAAIGVAAHETGHAIQHNAGYTPLSLRSAIVPVANIGSRLAVPLIIIGFLLSSGTGSIGMVMVQLGIILFAVAVLFQLVTLPVELNASSRALGILKGSGYLDAGEIVPAKKVLSAAAMTYVASALVAVAQLVRFILLSQRRR